MKRHTPVHLLCVLKARKQPVSSVNARELGCWRLFQVSALGVIGPLKSGSSVGSRREQFKQITPIRGCTAPDIVARLNASQLIC